MPEATKTHYETIGVDQDASAEEIRAAYRRQIRQVHPDVAGPDGAPRAAELSAAYAVLSRPDLRREYDETLRSGPEGAVRQEPVDEEPAWGVPSDWDEGKPASEPPGGEALDDAIVEEDPDPGTGRPFDWAVEPGRSPAEVQVRHPARHLLLLAVVGLLVVAGAVLFSWLSWTSAAIWGRQQTVAAAAIGGALGVLIGFGLHHRIPIRPVPAAIGAPVIVMMIEIGLQPPWLGVTRVGYAFVLGLAVAMVIQDRLAAQRRLNAVLPLKLLRRNNVFGPAPGDTGSELLERSCDPLYNLPGLRMIRTPAPDALFTHAFVCGSKVALVRALVADAGQFRWSGPTLFREGPDGWPTEVLRGPYDEFLRRSPQRFGRRTAVRSWIVVFSPDGAAVHQVPDPLMPSVTAAVQGIDAIGRYLVENNEIALVDHRRLVDAAEALYG